jgi:type IV secretion system protein VirD4
MKHLWPLWAWLIVRYVAAILMPGTDYDGPIMVLAPLGLFLLAMFLSSQGIASRHTPWLAAFGSMVSGLGGFYAEYLDSALILASGVALISPPVLLGVSCFLGRKHSTPYGSARWMSMWEARRILREGSLIIGEAYNPSHFPWRAGKAPLLRFDGRGHLMTVAGSGSGKTVSVAIPNCLSWDGSLVVHDPKGELAQLCAAARMARGRKVLVLDPRLENGDSVNVLDWLDPCSDVVVEHATAVISWLGTGEEPKGENAYFERAGKNLLLSLLLDIVCDPEIPPDKKNLSLLRRCVAAPDLPDLLEAIAKKGEHFAFGVAPQYAGELEGMARTAERQWTGVQSHASDLTAWLAIPSLSRLVCGAEKGGTVQTSAILSGTLDVFICIPLRTLESTPAVARLLLGSFLNSVYEGYRPGQAGSQRTLFLLDEMPRLRYLPLLETARDAGRGFGVTLWSIVQDFGQLEKYYGKEGLRSWMENSQIKTFFGIGDAETAKFVADLLGQMTIETETKGRNAVGAGGQHSEQAAGRPLMTPDEIMRMRVDKDGVPNEQLVFVRGRRPLRCGMAKWYRREEFGALVSNKG